MATTLPRHTPRPLRLPHAMPHLRGRWGLVVVWLYRVQALATAIVILGSLSFNGLDMLRNVPADMRYGFRTVTDADQQMAVVGGVTPAAGLAGLRAGDAVLAIAGRPLPLAGNEFDIGAAMDGQRADPLPVTVAGVEDGVPRTLRLPRMKQVWTADDPLTALPIWALVLTALPVAELPALILFAASFTLFWRRPHDPQAMLLAFAFLPGCWAPHTSFWLAALFHVPRAVLVAVTVPGWPLLLVALAGFPDGRYATRAGRLAVAGAVALLVLNIVILAQLVPPIGAQRVYRGVFAASAIAATVSVLVRYARLRPGRKRQQMKWTLFAAELMAAAAISGELVLPSLLPLLPPAVAAIVSGSVLLVAYTALPLGLLVSVLGYRMYDTEAAISRSTSIAVLTVALLAVFGGVQNTVSSLGQHLVGNTMGSFPGTVAAACASLAGGMMAGRIRAWTDKTFRQHLVRLQKGLPALVGDLRETAPPAQIREAVLTRVEEGVRGRWLAIADAARTVVAVRGVAPAAVDEWLQRYRPTRAGVDGDKADPLFPLRVPLAADGVEPAGWLLLGPRPDGSYYAKDERRVLGEVADPIARALAIATRRQALGTELERRLATLEAAVARLADQRGEMRG